jgi:hypothetical protein
MLIQHHLSTSSAWGDKKQQCEWDLRMEGAIMGFPLFPLHPSAHQTSDIQGFRDYCASESKIKKKPPEQNNCKIFRQKL